MIPSFERAAQFVLKNVGSVDAIKASKLFKEIAAIATKIDQDQLAKTATLMIEQSDRTIKVKDLVDRAQIVSHGAKTVSLNDLMVAAMTEAKIPDNAIMKFMSSVSTMGSPLYSPLPGNILPSSMERVVIDRQNEIARLAMLMNKKTRIIAVVGNKGVGKRAVINGVAKAIAAGKFPTVNITIVDLNEVLEAVGKMMGTLGEEDPRRNGGLWLPNQLLDNNNAYVLIDHERFARSTRIEDAMSMLIDSGANVILSTSADYLKILTKNSNMSHHIETVEVNELEKASSIKAVLASKAAIEETYYCSIPDSLCDFTVSISARFPMETSQPGRTISILELACATKRLGDLNAISKLAEADLETLVKQRKIGEAMSMISTNNEYVLGRVKMGKISITEQDISSLLAKHLGVSDRVPPEAITSDSIKQLSFLETFVKKYVYGQDEAVKAICDSIRRRALRMTTDTNPPSFLLVGSTGTGKTLTAKKIAELMFGSEKALIRIDMSEYMERHTTSRLIGSPPGYVGYEDGGQLTDKVRKRPHSVVLFDEIEKAHRDVTNILLQVLSDGRLTDGKGRTVSFSDCIIIMTSNLGTKRQVGDIGLTATSKKITTEAVMDAVKDHFSPELYNRIGKIVMFNSLGEPEVSKIVSYECMEMEKNDKFKLVFDESVNQHMVKKCISLGNIETYGGREVKRVIETYLQTAMTDEILKHEKMPKEVHVKVKDDELKVEVK